MDEELKEKATSRNFDPCCRESLANSSGYELDDKETAESAHILYNVVQSLEASAGSPGPIATISKGMDTA